MLNSIEAFKNSLLRWFAGNGRLLPWRENYDPYHVWLSEVMLQQTQMERGVAYFERWLRRFPDIESVAKAESYEIIKYWEGLGYYARARNLHKAAIMIVKQFDGVVPSSYDELLLLPGVGPYTASAVASIAYNIDIPVVDANVERVFSRLFDISEPLKNKGVHAGILQKADELLVKGQAREFNQALMDLGGTICTPKKPDCGLCPVQDYCAAYKGNFVEERPVKGKPQKLILIEMATGVLVRNGHVFIQQRHDNDIWGGLWEFPGGGLHEEEGPEEAVVREYLEETGFQVEVCRKITTVTHFHTKYKVILHCYQCHLSGESIIPELTAAQNFHWIPAQQLDSYGFPAGHRKFIEHVLKNCAEVFTAEC